MEQAFAGREALPRHSIARWRMRRSTCTPRIKCKLARKHASAVASSTSLKNSAAQAGLTELDVVSYTTRKSDIDVLQLQRLLGRANKHCINNSSWQVTQLLAHWSVTESSSQLPQLQQMLDKSMVVAAAYTRHPGLYTSSVLPNQAERGWEWPGGGAPRQQLQLVGFARACSDRGLVATIHDVVVHPALEGRGVGRRLVRSLVRAINVQGISDIGCCVPVPAMAFFQACSFDLDREGAVPMVLGPQAAAELAGASGSKPELQNNQALQRLLQRAVEDPDAFKQRVGFHW